MFAVIDGFVVWYRLFLEWNFVLGSLWAYSRMPRRNSEYLELVSLVQNGTPCKQTSSVMAVILLLSIPISLRWLVIVLGV